MVQEWQVAGEQHEYIGVDFGHCRRKSGDRSAARRLLAHRTHAVGLGRVRFALTDDHHPLGARNRIEDTIDDRSPADVEASLVRAAKTLRPTAHQHHGGVRIVVRAHAETLSVTALAWEHSERKQWTT